MARLALGVALAGAVLGCSREDIKVYRVAKELPEPAAMPRDGQHDHSDREAAPQLAWTLPEGWSVQPSKGSMRLATFAIAGAGGEQANAAVIALPAGRELDVINILRQNVGLGAATEEELTKVTRSVVIGPGQGRLIDMAMNTASNTNPQLGRILIAILEQNGKSWFFSMSGGDSFVREQQPSFQQFLKSITFTEAPAAAAPVASAPQPVGTNVKTTSRGADEGKPVWRVPPAWKEQPATQFRLGSFLVTGKEGRKVDISVTMLAGDGGGPLANVNRWRDQIKLPHITQAGMTALTTTIQGQDGAATMVDMNGVDAKSGQKARLIAAFQTRAGQTWFFKMLGDEELTGAEKDAFVAFVTSVNYGNSP